MFYSKSITSSSFDFSTDFYAHCHRWKSSIWSLTKDSCSVIEHASNDPTYIRSLCWKIGCTRIDTISLCSWTAKRRWKRKKVGWVRFDGGDAEIWQLTLYVSLQAAGDASGPAPMRPRDASQMRQHLARSVARCHMPITIFWASWAWLYHYYQPFGRRLQSLHCMVWPGRGYLWRF